MVSTLFERVVLGAAAATQCAKVHQTSQGFTVFLYNRYLGGGGFSILSRFCSSHTSLYSA